MNQSRGMWVIAIVGSRRRDKPSDYEILVKTLDTIYIYGDYLLSGGCYKGADQFAEELAKMRGIPMIIYEANWDQYGKNAGPIRNYDIAASCDVMIALGAKDRTGGTESSISYAKKLGKKVIII